MLFFNSIHNPKMSLDDLKIINLFTSLSCRKPSEVLHCSYVKAEICNMAYKAGNGPISSSSPSIALGLCFTKSLASSPPAVQVLSNSSFLLTSNHSEVLFSFPANLFHSHFLWFEISSFPLQFQLKCQGIFLDTSM